MGTDRSTSRATDEVNGMMTMAITRTAKTPVPTLKPSSDARDLIDPVTRIIRLGHFDLAESGHLELDHRLRQGRIPETRSELLPLGERPLHEVDHDFGL